VGRGGERYTKLDGRSTGNPHQMLCWSGVGEGGGAVLHVKLSVYREMSCERGGGGALLHVKLSVYRELFFFPRRADKVSQRTRWQTVWSARSKGPPGGQTGLLLHQVNDLRDVARIFGLGWLSLSQQFFKQKSSTCSGVFQLVKYNIEKT